MKSNRNIKIDYIRFISMILVIVIHVSNYYLTSFSIISFSSSVFALIWNILARVSVPFFLMISGSLLLQKDFDKNKYKKRILKIFIMLIFWNCFYFLVNKYLFNENLGLINLFYPPASRHLWFLYVLISLYFVEPIISKLMNSKKEKIIFLLYVLFLILGLFSKYFLLVDSIYVYLVYFWLGKKLFDKQNDINNKKLITFYIISNIVMIVLSIYLLIYNRPLSKYIYTYASPLLIISSGSLFVLLLKKVPNKINKYIVKLVPLSFGVYIVHMLILNIMKKIISISLINSFIMMPIIVIIILGLSLFIVWILKKIPIFAKHFI